MTSIIKYKVFMRIRYVRVSKEEQNAALQMDALKKYRCDKIFHEKI
jgi:DNA invertase Pin-like site-specific DNA recombinase